MLKARIITAAILIPLVILAIFFLPPMSFFSLALLLILLAGWEWAGLSGLLHPLSKTIFLVLLALAMVAAIFVPIYFIVLLGICWWLLALLLFILYPKWTSWWRNNKGILLLMGALVLMPCWIGLIILQGFSPALLMYCLILIWSVDSAAYFLGKKWGRHKLAPSISPGKSYEGLAAGLLAAALVAVIGYWVLGIDEQSFPVFLFLSMLGGGLISVFGDLFESMIKRQSHVKDSGSLLPGHGGFLDRIDSMTTAIPFFALVFPFFFNS